MSDCSLLEHTIMEILCAINPLQQDWRIRFQIISELEVVIQSIESLRGATVEPFGSFVSNLFTRWGDLDISIELANGPYIASAGKKHKQSLLQDVQRALRMSGGWHKLHYIANARIPILKLETNYNISCDISINNLSGQMKSKLLFWINEIDGRFRDMVLLVKEWAKAHKINDPKSGSLNSYSLSLLVLFHFQTCEPAILPPLREIYPGNMVDDLIGVRALAEKNVEHKCEVNINRYRSDKCRMINRISLSKLFISFLEKFSDIGLKASTHGICPYTGQWEEISTNMRWLPRTYALFIEDPFEQPVNTARTVGKFQLGKISEAIQNTYNMLNATGLDNILNATGLDRDSLVSTLVRQQRFVRGAPPRNQGGYSNGTHSHTECSPQFPSRAQQQQPQKKRIDYRQNGTTHKSALAHQNQVQQVWKPKSKA